MYINVMDVFLFLVVYNLGPCELEFVYAGNKSQPRGVVEEYNSRSWPPTFGPIASASRKKKKEKGLDISRNNGSRCA